MFGVVESIKEYYSLELVLLIKYFNLKFMIEMLVHVFFFARFEHEAFNQRDQRRMDKMISHSINAMYQILLCCKLVLLLCHVYHLVLLSTGNSSARTIRIIIIIIIVTTKCVLIYNPKTESHNECVCAKCAVTPKWLWERSELTHLEYLLLFSHRSAMHKCGYNSRLNRISYAFERVHSFHLLSEIVTDVEKILLFYTAYEPVW